MPAQLPPSCPGAFFLVVPVPLTAHSDESGARQGATSPPRNGVNDFPFDMPAKNDASVHPRLLRAVAQLLGTEQIRLSECQVWCKYGDYSAPQPRPATGQPLHEVHQIGDQSHHLDYGNGTLVVPPVPSPHTNREEVALILYLGTVEETGGATAVVPRSAVEGA
eukprot:SAG11_NODE_6804_length_1245_cov_1.242583_2_plen_164_part_00